MTQNFENHAKFVPAFHIVVLGIFTINLGWSLYRVSHAFSAESVISLLLAIAFILLALAALALAPDAALMPYADAAHFVLPKAIAGFALLLFLVLLAERPKATPARTAAEAINLVAAAPAVLQVAILGRHVAPI